MCNKKDSRFWKNLKIKIPESLKTNLQKWKQRLPIEEDFKSSYMLFYETNFALILKELNLIKLNEVKKEYKTKIQDADEKAIENYYKIFYKYRQDLINHKKYIKEINEYV